MTLLEAHKNPVAVGKFAFNEETYEKLISRKTATHSFRYGSGADAKLCRDLAHALGPATLVPALFPGLP